MDNPESQNLIKLLLSQQEGQLLDFKSASPEFTDPMNDSLQPWKCNGVNEVIFKKTVVAMYNTPTTQSFGYILYGVREENNPDSSGIRKKHIVGTPDVDDSKFHASFKFDFNVIPAFTLISVMVPRQDIVSWKIQHLQIPRTSEFRFLVVRIPTGRNRQGPCIAIRKIAAVSSSNPPKIPMNRVLIRRQSSSEVADFSEQLSVLDWFRRNGTLLSLQKESVLWEEMSNHIHHFSPHRKYMLFSVLPEVNWPELTNLALIDWIAIVDFDKNSASTGVKSILQPAILKRGRKVIEQRPEKGKSETVQTDATYWFFIDDANQGAQFKDGIQVLLSAIYPSPTTIIVLCHDPAIGETHLLRTLLRCDFDESRFVEIVWIKDAEKQDDDDKFWNETLSLPLFRPCWALPPFEFPYREIPLVVDRIVSRFPVSGTAISFPHGRSRVPRKLDDVALLHTLQSDWELVHVDAGHCIDDSSPKQFHLGSREISWPQLSKGNVAVRRTLQEIIENSIKSENNTPYTVEKVLTHEPGAGGTTLARQIAFSMKQYLPCLYLKPGKLRLDNSKTAKSIAQLNKLFQLKILLVVELSSEDGNTLLSELLRHNVAAILLRIEKLVHPHQTKPPIQNKGRAPNSASPPQSRCHFFRLHTRLDQSEALQFFRVFLNHDSPYNSSSDDDSEHNSDEPFSKSPSPPSRTSFELAYGHDEDAFLKIYQKSPHNIKFSPFLFSLFRYHTSFPGLKAFVEQWMHLLIDEKQLEVVRLVAFVQCYRGRDGCIPGLLLTKKLNITKKWTGHTAEGLPPHVRELLVEPRDDGMWRFLHPCIAELVLERSKCKLEDLANQFLTLISSECCAHKHLVQSIVQEVFIERRSTPSGDMDGMKEAFSPLIQELGKNPNTGVAILQRAIAIFSDPDPILDRLRIQLARYYSFKLQDHDEAMRIICSVLQSHPSDSFVFHIQGMIHRARLYTAISRMGGDDSLTTIQLVQDASQCFAESRKLLRSNEYAYVAQAQMIRCLITNYLSKVSPQQCLLSLPQNPHHDFFQACIFHAACLLFLIDPKVPGTLQLRDFFRSLFATWTREKHGDRNDAIGDDPRLPVWSNFGTIFSANYPEQVPIQLISNLIDKYSSRGSDPSCSTEPSPPQEEIDVLFLLFFKAARFQTSPLSIAIGQQRVDQWHSLAPESPWCSFFRLVLFSLAILVDKQSTFNSSDCAGLIELSRDHQMRRARKIRVRVTNKPGLGCLHIEDEDRVADPHMFLTFHGEIESVEWPNRGVILCNGIPITFNPIERDHRPGLQVTFNLGFSFFGPQASDVHVKTNKKINSNNETKTNNKSNTNNETKTKTNIQTQKETKKKNTPQSYSDAAKRAK